MTDGRVGRLRKDLQQPAGGWTVGVLTLLGAMLAPLLGFVAPSPVPSITMIVLLLLHLVWGSAGYYPRP